jgi:hypothetical protein
MKRSSILLTLLAVLFLPLFLSQELPANEAIAQLSNPQSEVQNPKLDKAEFAQKTMKLQMPFIANNGQVDEQVKFYAKTFGGTVFVTKEGEIVYALPTNSSECRGELHSPKGIHDEAGMLHDHHISYIVHPASWIMTSDSKSELQNTKATSCDSKNPKSSNLKSETCGEQSRTIQNIRAIALKEQFVGAKTITIQGEQPSITKVSYFKGNDPSKWKTNISTYDAVNLGEIYDGIELKLRAYGNNVEKLFCVKPGAKPEKIKLKLKNPNSEFQNPKLSVNEHGELEAETELGTVKFTKPVAYQEIDGKRVEVECKYTIADCGMQNVKQI